MSRWRSAEWLGHDQLCAPERREPSSDVTPAAQSFGRGQHENFWVVNGREKMEEIEKITLWETFLMRVLSFGILSAQCHGRQVAKRWRLEHSHSVSAIYKSGLVPRQPQDTHFLCGVKLKFSSLKSQPMANAIQSRCCQLIPGTLPASLPVSGKLRGSGL